MGKYKVKYYLIDCKGEYTDKKYSFLYSSDRDENYVLAVVKSMHMKDIAIYSVPMHTFKAIGEKERVSNELKFGRLCYIGEW